MIGRRYRVGIAAALALCLVRVPAAPAQPSTPAIAENTDGTALFGRTITGIQFRGNRKVEDDALRVNLRSEVGAVLTPETVRADLRALWQMGFFEDIRVEAEPADESGVVLIFAVDEKPSIRKVLVSGNDEIAIDKINEVLDLKREAILDIGKVKANRTKILDLYREKGYYLASVDYDIR